VTPLIGLSTVYCASKHTIGHIGDRFYGSNDPTSSVRALKEGVTALKKTPRTDRNHWSGLILSFFIHHWSYDRKSVSAFMPVLQCQYRVSYTRLIATYTRPVLFKRT